MKGNHYSIKDLENLTGIKAHTIRIWEQRYGLFNPQRTDTNIRFYTDNDLKKILNINLLYTNGWKISKIAKLDESKIIEESKTIIESSGSSEGDNAVENLLNCIMRLDEMTVQSILEKKEQEVGLLKMYEELVLPVLVRIGELWQLNSLSVGHEHFFSNQLKRFLNVKIEELETTKSGKKVILYLREKEEHEISLMFYHYFLKQNGFECYYLGKSLPIVDLRKLYDQITPDFVVTSLITHSDQDEFEKYIHEVTEIIEEKKLILSGSLVHMYRDSIPKNVRIIASQKDLNQIFV